MKFGLKILLNLLTHLNTSFLFYQIAVLLCGCSALERRIEDDFVFLPRATLNKNDARHKGRHFGKQTFKQGQNFQSPILAKQLFFSFKFQYKDELFVQARKVQTAIFHVDIS